MKDYCNKCKMWLKKSLYFLRLTDEHTRVSLTNLAMILILYKIYEADAASIKDVTALAIAIMGYQAKKFLDNSKE